MRALEPPGRPGTARVAAGARLAGIGERAELAWRDGEALYLPETLAVFPERSLNRDLYLWLAALAAADDGMIAGAWFVRNQALARHALDRYPGLRARYRRLVAAYGEANLVPWSTLEGERTARP